MDRALLEVQRNTRQLWRLPNSEMPLRNQIVEFVFENARHTHNRDRTATSIGAHARFYRFDHDMLLRSLLWFIGRWPVWLTISVATFVQQCRCQFTSFALRRPAKLSLKVHLSPFRVTGPLRSGRGTGWADFCVISGFSPRGQALRLSATTHHYPEKGIKCLQC